MADARLAQKAVIQTGDRLALRLYENINIIRILNKILNQKVKNITMKELLGMSI